MKTKSDQYKYIEWLTVEDILEDTRKWQSELEFIKDEELFFDDLIKSYTLQLINSKHFEESKRIMDKLSKFHKKTDTMIGLVKSHERKLKILVDGIDQPKQEDGYKKEHQWLINNFDEYLEKYKALKAQLFDQIKNILKEQKQKLLLQ